MVKVNTDWIILFFPILSDLTHTVAEQCSSSKEEIYGITFWCHDPSNHAWHPIDFVTLGFHHWLQPIEWHPEWETNQIFEYMISVIMRETPVIMSHSDFHQVARSSLRPVSVSCDRWPLPGKGCTEWFSFKQKKFAGRNHQCTQWHISLKTNIFDRPQVAL